MKKTKKIFLFIFLTIVLSIIVLFISSEIILRMLGYEAWYNITLNENEPTIYEFDADLGWKNKPGHYSISPFAEGLDNIEMTFLPDSSRITSKAEIDKEDGILALGGSYTQGWAISDWETYPWKLQDLFPDFKVWNFGTGGYGTYQSLLVLERIIHESRKPPALVIYGFIEHHEIRNTAPPEWMETLARFSSRGHVYVPYCTLTGKDKLIRHEPERYPNWPLNEYSATINYLQKSFIQLKASRSTRRNTRVTKRLIFEMARLCKECNASFLVVVLEFGAQKKNHYIQFFKSNHIDYVDCVITKRPELMVPGEGHPNGKMNSLWTERIGKKLNEGFDAR